MKSGVVYSTNELRGLIVPLVRKYGLRGARLFGSYARGEADASSDIDVLLDAGDGFRPLSIYALSEDLRASSGKDVDVYELSELNPGEFRDTVLREAIAL
ncbi:nucleotidyltransferase family protein [Olsenella uli]|uniref:nucleotidyltransferase family protein n=1 Tax=Olsenella uli TaxID=133926 RepID=UPI0012AC42CA|nr:nucleotidyltransferase domain-containing protein [Olsenella uli]